MDINHAEALNLLAKYKRLDAGSAVPVTQLYADFLAIYKNAEEMAAIALRRMENRNRELARARHGFIAKDVVGELEAIVGCSGHGAALLDG